MMKNTNKNTKNASINACDDYRVLSDNLSNPYHYNFGRIEQHTSSNIFQKMHNKVNTEYITKR